MDRSRTRTQSETSSKDSLKFSTNENKREMSECENHDPIDAKEESEGVSKCCKYYIYIQILHNVVDIMDL